jgi:hypothetical protein
VGASSDNELFHFPAGRLREDTPKSTDERRATPTFYDGTGPTHWIADCKGWNGDSQSYWLGAREAAIMMGIVVILVILWLLGVITKYTLGGLLHILLVVAIVFLLISVIRGRGL